MASNIMRSRKPWLIAALITLTINLAVTNGSYHWLGFMLMLGTFVCVLGAYFCWKWPAVLGESKLYLAVLITNIVLLCTMKIGQFAKTISISEFQLYLIGIGLISFLTGYAFVALGRFWRVFPFILVVFTSICFWNIKTTPTPPIDVYVIQTLGAHYLVNSSNPYTGTYPNIYGVDANGDSPNYGKGEVNGNVLLFGYIYPPANLLLSIPGYLAGDVRYSQWLIILVGLIALAQLTTHSVSKMAALILVTMPAMIQNFILSYSDLVLVGLICISVYAMQHYPRISFIPVALTLVFKQYCIFLFPLFIALYLFPPSEPRKRPFKIWPTIILMTVINVPFVLPDIEGFIYSTLTHHFACPFRPDSLTLTALMYRLGIVLPMNALSFLGPACAFLIYWVKKDKTWSGMFVLTTIGFLLFFFLSKQAFGNYYFFCAGLIAVALSLTGREDENHA